MKKSEVSDSFGLIMECWCRETVRRQGTRVSDQLSATITSDSFFSAVEELDPSLAVGLGRPRLDTKINKFVPPGLLFARSDSPRKNRPKIINYRQNVSMFGRLVASPPEKRGIPGYMLVL